MKKNLLSRDEEVCCIISIINFLTLFDCEFQKFGMFNIPSNLNMQKTLGKYNYNMISFTEYLLNDELENYSDFYWGDEALSFFKTELRNRKLEEIGI